MNFIDNKFHHNIILFLFHCAFIETNSTSMSMPPSPSSIRHHSSSSSLLCHSSNATDRKCCSAQCSDEFVAEKRQYNWLSESTWHSYLKLSRFRHCRYNTNDNRSECQFLFECVIIFNFLCIFVVGDNRRWIPIECQWRWRSVFAHRIANHFQFP